MLVACAAAACVREPLTTVHARLGADRPLSGLSLVATPYDPDAILDSLARVGARPKPEFPTLERSLLAYHRPAPGAVTTGPTAAWLTTRDSAAAMADSLRRVNRRAPGYAAAFNRFRALYERMVQRQRASGAGRVSIPEADRRLAERAASAADSLRAWEDVAYAAYPAVTQAVERRLGRARIDVETDDQGSAVLQLRPGRWWIEARLADPDNPFAERVWHVPVSVSARRSLVVPLFEGNFNLRWRH